MSVPELRPFLDEIRVDWSDDQLRDWAVRTAAALGWESEAAPRIPFDLAIDARMRRSLLELNRLPRAFFKVALSEEGASRPYRNLAAYLICHDHLTGLEPANRA